MVVGGIAIVRGLGLVRNHRAHAWPGRDAAKQGIRTIVETHFTTRTGFKKKIRRVPAQFSMTFFSKRRGV